MHYYKTEWNHFKRFYKIDFLISTGTLLFSTFLAYILLKGFVSEEMVSEMKKFVESSFASKGMTSEMSHTEAFILLFLNNTKASLLALAIGAIPFLFLPYFTSLVNGGIIGLVLFLTDISGHSVLGTVFLGILPHGVTELTAICLSVTLGIQLCKNTTKKLVPFFFKNKEREPFLIVLKRVGKTFGLVVVPLLFISALIEGYITPLLLNLIS